MKVGVVFPQTEIGADAGGVKAFAQAAEDLGYSHALAYDHVLGTDTRNRPNFRGPYTSESMFHEVFVLFGYLAGVTERLELATGILILPQRQTALVAKQAAEVDRLSNGRLRLGVAVGWNEVEYTGLDQDFSNRGRRIEEQIEVLRALWTNETVDIEGQWHRIPEAGLNPLPVQRPIPLWIGGYVPAALERAGRLGDGWFPSYQDGERPNQAVAADRARIDEAAQAAGRDPADVGLEGRICLNRLPRDEWAAATEAWREFGASHLSIFTMDGGLGPNGHIAIIREFREIVGLA